MAFKEYLEIIPETKEGKTSNIFREEVTDKTEVQSKIANAEKGFEGKKYTVRLHTCKHGKHGKNQPCEVEILKEIK